MKFNFSTDMVLVGVATLHFGVVASAAGTFGALTITSAYTLFLGESLVPRGVAAI